MGKNLSSKYEQKFLDTIKTLEAHALKTVSKTAIKITAEASSNLVENKIADNITKTATKNTAEDQKNLRPRKYQDQQLCQRKYIYLQKPTLIIEL